MQNDLKNLEQKAFKPRGLDKWEEIQNDLKDVKQKVVKLMQDNWKDAKQRAIELHGLDKWGDAEKLAEKLLQEKLVPDCFLVKDNAGKNIIPSTTRIAAIILASESLGLSLFKSLEMFRLFSATGKDHN